MKKTANGLIVSARMKKTAVVRIDSRVPHPLYKKLLARSKNIKADTGEFQVQAGDVVMIEETKPLSKDKHFRIISIISKKEE